ncbi:MAG: transglycosylase domain-containing protein [Chloroflexi bacterium]|nr:transglycosylase domain-containing protein [Chloroflexota bacterium]
MSSEDPTQPSQSQKPEPPDEFATVKLPPAADQPTTRLPDQPSTKTEPPKLPPVSPKVNLDPSGMPLPSRVPERDSHATRVQRRIVAGELATNTQPPIHPTTKTSPHRRQARKVFRAITVIALGLAALGVIAVAAVASYGVYEYSRIARTLPDPGDLADRASSFESTYIYDAGGNLLYEINDPNKGRRTHVPLDQISPYLIAATIATEDRDYYNHPGFDVVAILKAVYRAYRSGGELAGASTITQQITRALYFRLADCDKPDAEVACYEKSFERKLREIVLASEINRRYTKEQVLELYLNEIYYGNLAYGIEAAAKTYFNKDAKDLTLGEAAFLAGLPQSPAIYDVYTDPETVFARQKQVLILMVQASGDCAATGGIIVRTAPDQEQSICVTNEDAVSAILDITQNRAFTAPTIDAKYPHWVNYIRYLLEGQDGENAQALYRSGYRVYTTLNPALQDLAEAEVKAQVDSLAASNVTDGALVAIDPASGHILAMVGSNDYADPVDGQINMAIRPRQPGSSIKTLTYAAAFQKGWTPATLLWDVPTKFPDGANPPYEPKNYDDRFHGPVRVRDALANSYNIPAVKALEFVGVYDDPATPEREGLIAFAESLGITTLTRNDYGLALTLGGGEVTPLEMTGAYATLANNGQRVFPIAITRITYPSGATVCEQPTRPDEVKTGEDGTPLPTCQAVPPNWGAQIVRPDHAFLISDILADNHARSLAFGPNSTLHLSFSAAVKTGTTNDYRDNWTVGYTPNLAVGVWVGNADFTPMAQGVSGVTGAGPIWHNVMEGAWAALGTQPALFTQPQSATIANICAATGAAENDYCKVIVDPKRPNDPPVRSEFFAAGQPPLPADRDLVVKLFLDKFSGLRASEACNAKNPETAEEKTVVNISDPFALEWLEKNEQGQKWAAIFGITFPITPAPTAFCDDKAARAVAIITSPSENQTLDGVIDVFGIANVANGEFDHYTVDYGLGHDPGGWGFVSGDVPNPVAENGLLAKWDLASLPDGPATIRVVLYDKAGHTSEFRVRVFVAHPTATPLPPSDTPQPTNTPAPSSTSAPTNTPLPTASATSAPATDTPTATPETPTASATATTELPTDTPTPEPPTATPETPTVAPTP